jgi:glycolate oxidase
MNVDLEKLKGMVGADNIRSDPADLYIYGSDASVHEALPWVVVKRAR